MIILAVILFLFSNIFSWIVGMAFGVRFRSSYNLFNYLRSKPEWETEHHPGAQGEKIYAKDWNEARKLGAIHKVRILGKNEGTIHIGKEESDRIKAKRMQ